jgi:Domain of unknown function (DUF4180)
MRFYLRLKNKKMQVETIQINQLKIAELLSDEILITNARSGLNLLVDLYYQEFDGIILHEKNIVSDFFDLKTGIAGELLQKFSNYKMRLSIVGDLQNIRARA